MKFHDPSKVQPVQFHQSYSYEDFIQGFRPTENGLSLRPGVFLEFCERARNDANEVYVVIIDEINRGNLSKIFGELMLLIEPDKRSPEWATKLAYAESAEERFYVPPNIYLLGMMNTADRSLSFVDYALRRRFAFVTLRPEYQSKRFRDHLISRGVSPDLVDRIVTRMTALNREIEEDKINLGAGFCLGHSFFVPTETMQASDDLWYRRVIETEIAPFSRSIGSRTRQRLLTGPSDCSWTDVMKTSVPIENIYYLFCYAWERFSEGRSIAVGKTESPQIWDLFASILTNGVTRLLRRGLDRSYVECGMICRLFGDELSRAKHSVAICFFTVVRIANSTNCDTIFSKIKS